MQVSAILDRIRASIQVKLARQGMSPDREMLEEVCTAIAGLVRDPEGLWLQTGSLPKGDYAVAEDCLAMADRDFAEEISALRKLVASLEENMTHEMRSSVQSSQLNPEHIPHAIREMVLARFVYP